MHTQSQQNFPHVTTVTLLWLVQNFVAISRGYFKPEHCKYCLNFEFDRNVVSGMGTWLSCRLVMGSWMHSYGIWARIRTLLIAFCLCGEFSSWVTAMIQSILWRTIWTLTHLPLNKMATISQMIFSDAFWWMKNFVFWLKFHWSLFLRVQLTINQHWFR